MVPGTRPRQKKQKAATMAPANQQPPRTPIRFTRQSAAMPSPGGRPPPRQRLPLPPKNNSKAKPKPNAISSASQQQGHLNTSGSQTTQTTNTVPTTPIITMTSPAISAPVPITMLLPGANTARSTPRPTLGLSQQPTPTSSVNKTVGVDTSPGGQSSRQSNDISDSGGQSEAAISEGHTDEGEPDGDSVPGKQYVFTSIIFSMQYIDLLIL